MIDIAHIYNKIDSLADREEFVELEKLLHYWLTEAERENDLRAKLALLSEQIGFYRKQGQGPECLTAAEKAVSLLESTGFADEVFGATILLNAATGCKAFGMLEESLALFEKAREIYEKELRPDDGRLAGLYNNMGLMLADLCRFEDAEALYNKALAVLDNIHDSEGERAITLLNLADLETLRLGEIEAEEAVAAYLDAAECLLDTESLPQNGNYAFILEKCAPVFGRYGYFLAEQKFRKRAREIRERL